MCHARGSSLRGVPVPDERQAEGGDSEQAQRRPREADEGQAERRETHEGNEVRDERRQVPRSWGLPCSSEYSKTFLYVPGTRLQRLIRLARLHGYDLDFLDLDQCAFGLADPVSGRAFKKATRFLVSRRWRYSALGRRCRCRRAHQYLSGNTRYRGCVRRRTCFAECYPRRLAVALARVIR